MDDSSNSNYYSSVDQEIYSSKHVNKPSRKKCEYDKDFHIKNPVSIPGLVNGFENLPTTVDNIKMNSSRFPTVTISTPLTKNDLLDAMS